MTEYIRQALSTIEKTRLHGFNEVRDNFRTSFSLSTENHAIVAWFSVDNEKTENLSILRFGLSDWT